jgi:hypothetical protein
MGATTLQLETGKRPLAWCPITNRGSRAKGWFYRLAAVVALTAVPPTGDGLMAVSCRAADPLAVPIEGEPFPARLASVDADWKLSLTGGGAPSGSQRTVAAADLAWWGACREPARGPLVLLADGGVLAADVTAAAPKGYPDRLTAESDLLGTLKLPLEVLAGVVLRLPADRAQRDLLVERVARATGESDRVLLDNGDEVTGLIEAVADGKTRIRADAGPLDIPLRQVVALVLNPGLRQKPAATARAAWVGLSDGSRLLVTRLATEGPRLAMTTAAGTPCKAELKDVVFLLPLGGRAVYLSDLKPDEYRQQPYLDLPWPYHADRNVTGGLLRCGGRLWLKGLGVHSAATLTYALDGAYRRFQAELGIDDSTGGRGSVGFRVLVDGKPKYSSGPIRGGASPVPVSIDLTGAKRLELVVDYGEQADVLDHADWLGARLVK